MQLFRVENYPDCDYRDKIILKLLQYIKEVGGDFVPEGYDVGFDIDNFNIVITKEPFVSFWLPNSNKLKEDNL